MRDVLFEPRFRTAVDESYLDGRQNVLGAPMAVLTGDREPAVDGVRRRSDGRHRRERPTTHCRRSAEAVDALHTGVVLEAGDLLVVDNAVAVHGRSPFTARFDGTDRWLQRTFVVSDLAPSAADRVGRVITTRFGV